jgi:hypothetical protein
MTRDVFPFLLLPAGRGLSPRQPRHWVVSRRRSHRLPPRPHRGEIEQIAAVACSGLLSGLAPWSPSSHGRCGAVNVSVVRQRLGFVLRKCVRMRGGRVVRGPGRRGRADCDIHGHAGCALHRYPVGAESASCCRLGRAPGGRDDRARRYRPLPTAGKTAGRRVKRWGSRG